MSKKKHINNITALPAVKTKSALVSEVLVSTLETVREHEAVSVSVCVQFKDGSSYNHFSCPNDKLQLDELQDAIAHSYYTVYRQSILTDE